MRNIPVIGGQVEWCAVSTILMSLICGVLDFLFWKNCRKYNSICYFTPLSRLREVKVCFKRRNVMSFKIFFTIRTDENIFSEQLISCKLD